MLRKVLFILFMSLAFVANAQYSIKGKITDAADGSPLVGAHIMLLNTHHKAVSSDKGTYSFTRVAKGEYTLRISFVGYATFEQTMVIKSHETVDVKLEMSSILEDAVVISSTRFISADKSASQTIEKVEIQKANLGQDIPYILDQTPSMVVGSDAGAGIGYTNLRVRGSDITRINFTVNGIPLNDPESHGVFFVNMGDFASSLNSIHIQRGVGTSTNGAAAFGASINMQTTTLNKKPYAEVNTSFGSFNTQKYNLMTGTGLINGKLTIDTRVSKLYSDGFVDRAFSDLKSLYTSAAYYGDRSILRFTLFTGKEKTYQSWYGIPKDSLKTNRTYNPYTYENETDNYQQDHYQLHYSKEFNRYNSIHTALHYTRGRGYYESYKEGREFTDYGLVNPIIGLDTITETDLVQQKWLDNHFYGATFAFNHDNLKNFKATLGGAINQYDGDHYGEIIWAQYALMGKDFRWYTNNGLKTDMNVYAKGAYKFTPKLQVFADVQYRHINYKMEGLHDDFKDLTSEHTFDFINPKAGVSYEIDRHHQTYLTLALSNREPSRNNFRDADVDHMPKPEQLLDLEMGYTYTGEHWKMNSNLYYMYYNNQLVLTGEINNVGSAIMTNVETSYRRGIEFISAYRLNKFFALNTNLALSENKIEDFTEYFDNWDTGGQESRELGTTDISFSPSFVAGNEIVVTPVKDLDISLISKYVSRQYIDNTSNKGRSLDPYLVHNLRLTYSIKTTLIKRIGFHVQVNNLLNEEYETNAWVYHYSFGGVEYDMDGYFPQAGTNFLAGVSLRF